ncbi:translation initiation factor IF6 [Russula brevipes]|nr:translation initiation factor IF6 [Russula brevipes]
MANSHSHVSRLRVTYSRNAHLSNSQASQFENSSDISVFSELTDSYLVSIQGSTDFYPPSQTELSDVAPIVHTSIGGTRILSRLMAGYCRGILVPSTTTAERYATAPSECSPGQRFSSARREWHSGLGNAITCDDHVALVHPNVDRETEEIIADVLKVEGLTMLVSQSSLFGI